MLIWRGNLDLMKAVFFLPVPVNAYVCPKATMGSRAITIVGNTAYVANYFSDTLSVIDMKTPHGKIESIPLGPKVEMSAVRKGGFYFHDATICQEGWQSCSSCHPGNARADGLNWDLPNDGLGHPKNTKSLLLAHHELPCLRATR